MGYEIAEQMNGNRIAVVRGGGEGDSASPPSHSSGWRDTPGVAAAVLPWASWSLRTVLKSCLAATVALYVLNQKHLLPKPLSAVVSKALFWPTLPITVSRRLGVWSTPVDDTVIIGGAPFGFAKFPQRLYNDYGVRGVINLCEEYAGPQKQYQQLGMAHLRLPTVDHFEPTMEDLEKAVSFIQKHQDQGEKVYVHCRAGHGRSAAVVFAWLVSKDPDVDLRELNEEFCQLRNVRKTLWKQTNINRFHAKLQGYNVDNVPTSDSDGESDYNEYKKDL